MTDERVTLDELLYIEDLAYEQLWAAVELLVTTIKASTNKNAGPAIASDQGLMEDLIAARFEELVGQISINGTFSALKLDYLKKYMLDFGLDALHRLLFHEEPEIVSQKPNISEIN